MRREASSRRSCRVSTTANMGCSWFIINLWTTRVTLLRLDSHIFVGILNRNEYFWGGILRIDSMMRRFQAYCIPLAKITTLLCRLGLLFDPLCVSFASADLRSFVVSLATTGLRSLLSLEGAPQGSITRQKFLRGATAASTSSDRSVGFFCI